MKANMPLTNISPVDGRYHDKTGTLKNYFSEFALMKIRVHVEIEYFISLCQIPLKSLSGIDRNIFTSLRLIYVNFSVEDAQKIKETEKRINHDVKAVEYFVKEKFESLGLAQYKEFVHFGLTSQDINNTAIPLATKEFLLSTYYPELEKIITQFKGRCAEWEQVVMLARTHGQPASPTLLGKEIYVFVARIEEQKKQLEAIKHSAKFGGATGNMNAHYVAYPEIEWHRFADVFVEKQLGLSRSYPTTQIEHYDNLAAQCDALKRINNILIDFCRDMWAYISIEYFKQMVNKNETGSSAMPHKINPIDFENAEGNLGVANALFEHFSSKLPISRLQRDLTDSTVIRNIGVPMAHTIIALQSLGKGLNKILLNREKINADLEANPSVVAEAIQTILRSEMYPEPYEKLKELTRKGEHITRKEIEEFIVTLDVNPALKERLLSVTAYNYSGKFSL